MSGGMIVGRQNRLMEAFENAGATAPGSAAPLDSLGCHESFIFRRMASSGVFRSEDGERYWMDLEAAAAFVHRRHWRIIIYMLLAFTVAVLLADY